MRLLSATEQASVHRAEMRLASARLPAAELDFLRANLWLSHDLYAEAIRLLERLAQAQHAEPAVNRLLGECYELIELPDRAATAYRAALADARAGQDLDSQATLELALARVSTTPDESKRLVQQAAALYRRLGDNQKAAELLKGQD
jgi:tetratricopeptide (TPR) repeat protein